MRKNPSHAVPPDSPIFPGLEEARIVARRIGKQRGCSVRGTWRGRACGEQARGGRRRKEEEEVEQVE